RASRETFHIELFDHDLTVIAHEPRTRLMQMIGSLSRRGRMAAGKCDSRLASATRTPHLARQRTLRDPQAALGLPCRSQARNESAIGKGGKGRDPEIDPDRTALSARRSLNLLDDETNGPASDI